MERTVEYLKARFQQGMKPTAEDFGDLMDTMLTLTAAAQNYMAKSGMGSYLTKTEAGSTYLPLTEAGKYALALSETAVEEQAQVLKVKLSSAKGEVRVLRKSGSGYVLEKDYSVEYEDAKTAKLTAGSSLEEFTTEHVVMS